MPPATLKSWNHSPGLGPESCAWDREAARTQVQRATANRGRVMSDNSESRVWDQSSSMVWPNSGMSILPKFLVANALANFSARSTSP